MERFSFKSTTQNERDITNKYLSIASGWQIGVVYFSIYFTGTKSRSASNSRSCFQSQYILVPWTFFLRNNVSCCFVLAILSSILYLSLFPFAHSPFQSSFSSPFHVSPHTSTPAHPFSRLAKWCSNTGCFSQCTVRHAWLLCLFPLWSC